jgi:hypothetical protein
VARIYLRVDLPDDLLIKFHQAIRDFDTKHDPDHKGIVQFAMLGKSDLPAEKLAGVFKNITPPFAHISVTKFDKEEK